MRRKVLLVAVLALCLGVLLATAIFLPTLAQSQQSESNSDQSTQTAQTVDPTVNGTVNGYGGSVVLQLPPGGGALADRPNNLRLQFSHIYNGSGTWFGVGDTLTVSLWIPSLNMYIPVAQITNNNNTSLADWVKVFAAGSPAGTNNFVVLSGSPNPLSVEQVGDLVVANLTAPVNITFSNQTSSPYNGLDFTLPPLSVEFSPIGGAFHDSENATIVTSGWMQQIGYWAEPAFARVWIPQWLGGTCLTATGIKVLNSTTTYLSP